MKLVRDLKPEEYQTSLVRQVWEHELESFNTLYLVVSEQGKDSRLLCLDTGDLFWMRTDFMQDSLLWRRVA